MEDNVEMEQAIRYTATEILKAEIIADSRKVARDLDNEIERSIQVAQKLHDKISAKFKAEEGSDN